MMNTVEAAKKVGLSYEQVRYLCNRGIVTTAPTKQGKDRQLNDNDLNIIELAAALRSKRIGFRRVHPAVIASYVANKNLPFLYVYEGLRPFVVLWDGYKWEVENSTMGISNLYKRAEELEAIIYGKWDKRIEALMEVQHEQPNP